MDERRVPTRHHKTRRDARSPSAQPCKKPPMKNPFNIRAPAFDAQAINATIARALASAGLDTTSGTLLRVTETIKRALAPRSSTDMARGPAVDTTTVVDVVARDVTSAVDAPQDTNRDAQPMPAVDAKQAPGSFRTHAFSNHAGTLSYKLYVPARTDHTDRTADAPRPLLVMLHGCTQSADDFAAGTQMNRLAEEHGLLVVYPEQTAQANASKCWNWFKPQDQRRGAGEPALIAGMVSEVAARHGADPRRIFVAGLSAGAAMAVVLGQTYPELFAGVGAHSGLPFGSAHDVPSALAAMKGGRGAGGRGKGLHGTASTSAPAPAPTSPSSRKATRAVPTIVFHGDRDHTVQQGNGAEIVQQASEAHQALAAQSASPALHASSQKQTAPGGRSYTRSVLADAQGRPTIEHWTLHGAGHAWSGGHASGSYTDASGPDAAAEMLRFFLALDSADSEHAGSDNAASA